MHKRLALLFATASIVAALALPAGAAAAQSPYSYAVLQNYCDGGQPNIKVRMTKPAGYYPDKFSIAAQGQHSNSASGPWSNEGQSSTFNKSVPNQYAKFTWAKAIYWNPPDNQWHRIKLRLKVYDHGGVVAAKTIYSVKC